jgi:hypothetical protein
MDAKAGAIERGNDQRIDEAAERLAEPDLRARYGALLFHDGRARREGREHVRDGRVIARLAARVAERELASGPDHEHASELPGVALHGALPRAGAKRAQGVEREPRREQLDAAAPQRRPDRHADLDPRAAGP